MLELNASDDRGINVIRQRIKGFCETMSALGNSKCNFKLVVLDEADNMTKEAQAALRRMMEQYSKGVRFCLICNHVTSIISAL